MIDFSADVSTFPFGVDQEKVAAHLENFAARIRSGDVGVSRCIEQAQHGVDEFGSRRLLLWFEEKKL